jgi:hypothetical protein
MLELSVMDYHKYRADVLRERETKPGSYYITTYPKKINFHVFAPLPQDIWIEDIFQSLSRKPRWNGHQKYNYSVIQHSYEMYKYLRSAGASDVECHWALLHDAAEAYVGDIPSPVKKGLVGYDQIENRILECIALRFGLPPLDTCPIVKEIDVRIRVNEYETCVNEELPEWCKAEPLPYFIENNEKLNEWSDNPWVKSLPCLVHYGRY